MNPEPTIDRQARDKMVAAVRSYMAERTTAFQFDDSLQATIESTHDKTVQYIGDALWFHYDDCKDHKIHASREQWDYFNRLLLILESDAEIVFEKSQKRWHWRQAIAAVSLAGFVVLTTATGFGLHLLAVAIPFGAISMLLGWFASREGERTTSALEVALTPFPTVASLLAVRRRVPGFARTRYHAGVSNRPIRSPAMVALLGIHSRLMWLLLGPIVLLFQILPERASRVHIG